MNGYKNFMKLSGALMLVFFIGSLSGCAYGPAGPYSATAPNPVPPAPVGAFNLDPNARTYAMRVENNTPFGVNQLPMARDMLYNKGYDLVRSQREADFALDITLSAGARDNPDVRATNAVGGALIGAATGAIIGAAVHNPGAGAAIGAASGGVLGLAAPAATGMLQIDVNLQNLRDGSNSQRSVTIDLATVPPYEIPHVVDQQVSHLVQSLPRR